jgi:UV DNA damage repair endonuclease
LPEGLRRRLVVENEEHGWTPARVLPVARAAGAPVVLDAFHLKLSDGPGADLRGAAEAAPAT